MSVIGEISVSRKPPRPKPAPKPAKPKKPKAPVAYIFRYFSSRGTDQRICVLLRGDITPKEVRDLADDWSTRETAGTACYEYTVQFWKVKLMPRQKWLKKWDILCKRKNKIEDAWKNHRAINNAYDWSKQ